MHPLSCWTRVLFAHVAGDLAFLASYFGIDGAISLMAMVVSRERLSECRCRRYCRSGEDAELTPGWTSTDSRQQTTSAGSVTSSMRRGPVVPRSRHFRSPGRVSPLPLPSGNPMHTPLLSPRSVPGPRAHGAPYGNYLTSAGFLLPP